MAHSRWPPSTYEGWMVGDMSTADTRRDEVFQRQGLVRDLEKTIEEGQFSADHLREMIKILDHEYLCVELEQQHFQDYPELPIRALGAQWTLRILVKLSECLVHSINDSSHFERELQSRAISSALTLLRAYRVEAIHVQQYDALYAQLGARFQDLQWQRTRSGLFTRERFRQFQCSYLLCSGAEYARQFRRAQPLVANVISRLVNVLFAGIFIAVPSATGNIAGSPQAALRELDQILTPLWRNPHEQYQALLSLQELTRISLASHVAACVRRSAENHQSQREDASRVLACSLDFATIILREIQLELNNHEDFETHTSPRSAFRGYFLAFFERGPPAMDEYLYLYGLLDCATQLSRILPYGMIEEEFKRRMTRIILRSREPSYRWKAIEFLLADAENRDIQRQNILNEICNANQEMQRECADAIDIICDCLLEEDGLPLLQRLATRTLSQVSIGELPTISPDDWLEDDIAHSATSTQAYLVELPLERRQGGHRTEYLSAGFSPNCRSAFFLSKNYVAVYCLRDLPITRKICAQHKPPQSLEFEIASLSERLLVIVSKKDLMVLQYGLSTANYSKVGTENFDAGESKSVWDPSCLAIHETGDQAWIAIGGRERRQGDFYASIRIYRVEFGTGYTTLVRHLPHSHSLFRDALARDFLQTLNFSPDGLRLVCVTNNNRVLTWSLSNEIQPRFAPFPIWKRYTRETTAHGITSATLFHSPSRRPYVLCTTSPSRERVRNGGEWSFISPVSDSPAIVPPELEQDLTELGRSKPMLTGAATPTGHMVALLQITGRICLCHLSPGEKGDGGLTSLSEPVILEKKLCKQLRCSPQSLRFHVQESDQALYLYAIDIEGTLIRKRFDERPPATAL